MKCLIKILIVSSLILGCSNNYIIKDTSVKELQLKITRMINEARVEKGLNKLEENKILDALALEHCRKMKNKARASHSDYEYRGRIVSQLFDKRNYNENVAYVWAYDKHIEQVLVVWLNSKKHAANIYGDFDLTGVAIDQDDFGGFYITQIFVND